MTFAEINGARVVAFPSCVVVQYNGKSTMLPHSVAQLAYECVMSEQQAKPRERIDRGKEDHL